MGGANCLSDQWQMREVFKKLDWKLIIFALPFSSAIEQKWHTLPLKTHYVSAFPRSDSTTHVIYSEVIRNMLHPFLNLTELFVFWTRKALSLFVNLRSVRVAVSAWSVWLWFYPGRVKTYSLTFLHIITVHSGQTWIEMKLLLLTRDQSLILSSFMYILFLRDALIFPLDAKKLRFIFVLHSFMQIYRSSSAESRI